MGRLWSEDYLRDGPRETYTEDEEAFKVRYAFASLIRNGITTALPITSMYYRAWAESYDEFARVAAIAGELGLRVYIGPCYMSGTTYVRRDRTLAQHWDEPRGLAGLEQAIRFFRDFDGAHGGLVRGMFAPDRIETCTPELLSRTAAASAELGAPVRLHCCQSTYEFETVLRLRGCTPLAFIERAGLLTPRAILPHGIYLSGHPQSARRRATRTGDGWSVPARASRIARPCSRAWARRSIRSGVTAPPASISGLGTDTWPPDLLHNMRLGLYVARVMEGDATHTSMADMIDAATLGGARALGRDDLGRARAGRASRHRRVRPYRPSPRPAVRPAQEPHACRPRHRLPRELYRRPLRHGELRGEGRGCERAAARSGAPVRQAHGESFEPGVRPSACRAPVPSGVSVGTRELAEVGPSRRQPVRTPPFVPAQEGALARRCMLHELAPHGFSKGAQNTVARAITRRTQP